MLLEVIAGFPQKAVDNEGRLVPLNIEHAFLLTEKFRPLIQAIQSAEIETEDEEDGPLTALG